MFEKKSNLAQWEIVFMILKTKNVGDIVTDEEILSALGPDFPKVALHSVVNQAIKKFRVNKRTFERIRLIGWRMVEATEHSRLARKQQLRSRRRLDEAVSISASTDLSKLSPDERRAQREQELHLRQLRDQVARHDRRLVKVERRVSMVEKDYAGNVDEIDKLKDLLRRHGIFDDE